MESTESPTGVEQNLNELAVDMFQKSAEYIEAELAVAQDDYKLLTELNKECDMTYAGLRKIGGNLNKQLKEMTEKHLDFREKDAALKPYLEMIDSINESTSKLEAVAYMMDAYTKRLEAKFKSLEKR
ncbi:biogenesis of lysosome-related organelles complex 1 subunit 2 isoform X3 [Parasteatoda tepidariorum]|uniref:biogenesis of lysosome-related organelles complex 1 subunit 2 isoform X3 n=1 Tax=Parasteatoda tepidariorum TaxID=114398 RepID=UPI00077FDCB2